MAVRNTTRRNQLEFRTFKFAQLWARVKEFLWLLPHATIRLQAVGRWCAASPSLLYPLSNTYVSGKTWSFPHTTSGLVQYIYYVFYAIKVVKSLEYFIVNIFLAIRKLVWYHLPALVSKYRREVASALHRKTENWSAKEKYVNIAWIFKTGT